MALTMALEYINIVGIKSLQTVLNRIKDVLAGETSLISITRCILLLGSGRRSLPSYLAGEDWHIQLGKDDNFSTLDTQGFN